MPWALVFLSLRPHLPQRWQRFRADLSLTASPGPEKHRQDFNTLAPLFATPPCLFPTGRMALCDPSSSSTKVMASESQEETKRHKEETCSSGKRASHNEEIRFQSRWEKIRGPPLSVNSTWKDGEWKQPLKQPPEAGGRAGGKTSSKACTLLLAVTLLRGPLGYLKLDGLYLTTTLAIRGSGQGCDELLGEGHSSPHVASPGSTSDFKVLSLADLGILGLACLHLRSRPPISAPFPHSLCIWVSVSSEASPPDRNIQTCLQAEDWKAAFLYLLGFSFSFHELTLQIPQQGMNKQKLGRIRMYYLANHD